MTTACRLCERLEAGARRHQPYVFEDGPWRVTPPLRFLDDPGWTYVALGRHVESLDEMTPAEARALGGVLARTAHAIERVTGAERVYVMTFGEVLAHLHFLLTPRLADLPPEHRGAHIWDRAEALEDADEALAVNEMLLAFLEAGTPATDVTG